MKINFEKKLIQNTLLLYLMTGAKLILPLITLPYLTRVLSTEGYGVVVYVKSIMSYVQLIIDFGFILSATKDIITILNNQTIDQKKEIGIIVGDTFIEKAILALICAIFLLFLSVVVPLLQNNLFFLWLYFFSYVISIFLADFLFRGLEKMEMVTIPFIISKTISTLLTFYFVVNDNSIIYIALLEVIGNLVAVIVTLLYIRKLRIKIKITNFHNWIKQIKDSFIYFLSNFATTAFGALNTFIIGLFLNTTDIAFWGIALQLVSAVQQMYTPIFNSLYPHMLKVKSRFLIKKIIFVFTPIIIVGCVFCFICAKWIIVLISGPQYQGAVEIFRALIPIMFISFYSMLFGWPVLGAINKTSETTFSTIMAAIIQILLLLFIILTNQFTLLNIAYCRIISELSMFIIRFFYFKKYQKLYID